MDDIGKQVVRHWHWFCVARSETQDVNESAIAMTLTRGLLMPVLMADSQRELALNEKWFNGAVVLVRLMFATLPTTACHILLC